MKLKKLIVIAMFSAIMFMSIPAMATTTDTASITTSSYARTTDDKVTATVGYSFGLDNNYTLIKLYFSVYSNSLASGQTIASHIVDVATYNHLTSGTAGLVTGATDFAIYDSNAQDLEVIGGDPIYLFVSVYNGTITASTLIKKSVADLDYFPEDGRFGNSDTVETTTDYTWYYVAMGGVGIIVVLWALNRFGIFSMYSPGRDTLEYSDGRKSWAHRWKTFGTHKRATDGKRIKHEPGQFRDIVDPKHAMNRDRATPHRYRTGADRRPPKK